MLCPKKFLLLFSEQGQCYITYLVKHLNDGPLLADDSDNMCSHFFTTFFKKITYRLNSVVSLNYNFTTLLTQLIFLPYLWSKKTHTYIVFFKQIRATITTFLASSFAITKTSYLVVLFVRRELEWWWVLNKFLAATTQITPLQNLTASNLFQIKNPTTYRSIIAQPKLLISALAVFYKSLKSIILPLILSLIFFIILLDFFSVDFLRQTGIWTVFGFLGFWLFSSFNFFIKRYRFGKFTSAIQRFWKRTNSYFWIIEGFMFGLFFYYYLNSAQEPLYMYDESNMNQNFLPSLVASYQSYLVLLFILFYTFYLMLSLPTFKSTQQIFHLGLMTLAYTYIYLLENYQVYYLLTSFFENYWVYDTENALWSLEVDVPRVRVKQQYFYIALVLKYWHFIFIYLSWLFVAMKCYEKKQLSYLLLSLSSQNVLILFTLNIMFNAQWLNWLVRRFSDSAYYWFFSNPNEFTLLQIFQEIFACVCFTVSF